MKDPALLQEAELCLNLETGEIICVTGGKQHRERKSLKPWKRVSPLLHFTPSVFPRIDIELWFLLMRQAWVSEVESEMAMARLGETKSCHAFFLTSPPEAASSSRGKLTVPLSGHQVRGQD